MNSKYVALVVTLLIAQRAHGQGLIRIVSIATELLSTIATIADTTQEWFVEVHNEGDHHAHLWCASKDDRIGGEDGLWVQPGDKLVWSFRRHSTTQFWCTLDWNGQRVGWDVYVTNWRDAPNPTKWSIRNDGVYDQWANRRWRDLSS